MRILKISPFFTLLFLYFYSQLLNADTKVELQPVTVEESGFTVDIYNPVIPITIITKDDISQKQPINTFALLNKIPGINIDRSSSLIAIGGGTIGDLSGFIAGTILRGIRFISIPTTLFF